MSRHPVLMLLALLLWGSPAVAAPLPEKPVLRTWIEEMKHSERGPFARIRWFCKDGAILPPEPYACREEHGGGYQHGEWTGRVKLLRANGYFIANVLSDLDASAFAARPDVDDAFSQILIEQYLVRADNGWILRRARYYRGALQEEGERLGARRLLLKLVEDPDRLTRRYAVLRDGARLMRHGTETASVAEMRQLATSLAERDPGFVPLRNKMHAHPDASDAARVRAYAAKVQDAELKASLAELAGVLEHVYSSGSTVKELKDLTVASAGLGDLPSVLDTGAKRLEQATDPAERLAVTADLLGALRDRITRPNGPLLRLKLLDASVSLADEFFTAGAALRERFGAASRRQRLDWLSSGVDAAYGTGLLTGRERDALRGALARLTVAQVPLADYKEVLDYLALAPGWGAQRLRYFFGRSVQTLAGIEPRAGVFIQDLLRSSPLLFYSQTLDGALVDANRLAGVRHELFGEDVGAGLRPLNPGLARGVLHVAASDAEALDPAGIYLLPETTSDLPPVAGILTEGEGNPLSHVQLLARNLGIPNVAVDVSLVPRLKAMAGHRVILAVSPKGAVRLAEDRGKSGPVQAAEPAQVLIQPDLNKLDLSVRGFIALSDLRATDSGRIVGPKAAKLGELYHSFPGVVAEGLAIPFGSFRQMLDQPYGDGARSVYDWMVGEYRRLAAMAAGSPQRSAATEIFREKLYDWILHADPGPEFRERLRRDMARQFGADGSYGVFVRSDTNVEDLPGFTGAGLNLTLPNVVGFDNVMRAISQVWASPFTERAFAWRQSHMDQPQHVYPAVLLLRSVPSEKSGVMVTRDVDTGAKGWLTVAVNEGVGGAVDGQAAESLRINTGTGALTLMAEATAPLRREVASAGGLVKVPASGADRVLQPDEIAQLIELARVLPRRFPAILDADGNAAPADIEFGFVGGKLRLFQIRPFLESKQARGSEYLKSLDAGMRDLSGVMVDMQGVPGAVP